MKHWLVKSEPGTYSWEDLRRDGRTPWDGVRNFQARNNLRAMRPSDLALFYHSVNERRVVGVARVVSEPYADPSASAGDWSVVDLEPAFALARPITLDDIKADAALSEMVLVRQSRLSVQPVQKAEFDRIVKLGGRARN
jgi:predicted RNA-binding protein with PUA-like domain